MNLCSIHGHPNNSYGYCSGCESDPSIDIRRCKSCGNPFAVHFGTSTKECSKCTAERIIRDDNKSGNWR